MTTDTHAQLGSAPPILAIGSPANRLAWSEVLIIILVAWLGEYAGSVATVAPVLVDAWTSWFGVDNATAGILATSGLLGESCGLFIGILLVSRWPLARLAWLGLLITIPCDAISIFIDHVNSMLAVRSLHGIGLGLLLGAAINWMGRHEQSVRAFAVFILLQAVLPRAFMNLVPLLTPQVGHASVYVGLIVWALSCTLFIRVLSHNGGDVPVGRTTSHARAPWGRQIAAVLAMVLFNFTAIGTWAFLMRYADSKGLSAALFLQIIAYSAVFAIIGGWLAYSLSTRLNRTAAILSGYALLILNTLALVTLPVTPATFAAESFVGGLVTSFLIPYMLGTQSALDSTGRLPVWGLIGGTFGGSLGPLAFGFISQHFSYTSAFLASACLSAIGCGALIIASRYTTRTEPDRAVAATPATIAQT